MTALGRAVTSLPAGSITTRTRASVFASSIPEAVSKARTAKVLSLGAASGPTVKVRPVVVAIGVE